MDSQVEKIVREISKLLPLTESGLDIGKECMGNHSSGSDSRIIFHLNRARIELESATRIEEVKEIRDKAQAMRSYAQQIKLSIDLQNMCAEIKIRAERKMGEFIQQLNIQNNSSSNLLRGRTITPRENIPTLAELGISKSQSSRCQLLALLNEEEFAGKLADMRLSGRELTTSAMIQYAKSRQLEKIRIARVEQGFAVVTNPDDMVRIVHGDFRSVLAFVPDDSVDLVITDPPYLEKYLPILKDLGSFCKRVLKHYGLLITYAGTYHLPDFMRLLGRNLNYVWTAAITYPNIPATIYSYHIKSLWKPILIYSKSEYRPSNRAEWFRDRLEGDGRTKENHDWEQGLGEAQSFIQYFTFPGDLVVDPFLGSGTNGVAATRLKRQFIGCDKDESSVGISLARIKQDQQAHSADLKTE